VTTASRANRGKSVPISITEEVFYSPRAGTRRVIILRLEDRTLENVGNIRELRPLLQKSQCEIFSSARPRVRGPKMPIDSITISIDAAMKAKTPATPKSRRKNPIKKLVKIALNRLQE